MAAASAASTTCEWWWLGFEQKLPVRVEQWARYEPAVEYQLSQSHSTMQMEDQQEGLVLDLAPFTDPPSPHQVWRGRPVEVTNTNAGELVGRLAVAGYTKELWDLPADQLPPSAGRGRVVGGFYQIQRVDAPLMGELNRYLADPRNQVFRQPAPPRRRVVILVESDRPDFLFKDVNRFRRRRSSASVAVPAPIADHDAVPLGDAVFQWWWGDARDGGWGHWKNYHPHVSKRLEQALAENERFRNCLEAVDIDQVRYSLQRISREHRFDYLDQNLGGNFREPFLPENVVTTACSLYDDQARMTNNCFVQFQRGNPKRRRPVRRIRRGEAAGLEMPSGEPCGICFSDTGVLTGCPKGHIVCNSCLRAALRILVGDITVKENLVCGCLSASDTVALQGLARRADDTLQAVLATSPGGPEQRELDMEMAQLRRAFQLPERIPPSIFQRKIEEWQELIRKHDMEHLYHACSVPGCGMENWILRKEFDENHRCHGRHHWTCKRGHCNAVLPSQQDIDEINRNILLHPEHYTSRCGADSMPLRRFRICPGCTGTGLLTFAVHEAGCKQWPGSRAGHIHQFCFHCTKAWGSDCDHSVACQDPGIQQVRRSVDAAGGEVLEIGFIDAEKYLAWIGGTSANSPMAVFSRGGAVRCPPTVFPSGQVVLGATRQGQLGMEDTQVLRRLSQEGTR